MGPCKKVVRADGSWEWYVYDAQQRPLQVFSGFKNQEPTTNASLCRLVENTYTNDVVSGSGDEGDLQPLTPRRTVEYLLGEEVSRRYTVVKPWERREIQCQTAGAAWNDEDNLVTTYKYYSSGDFMGQLAKSQGDYNRITLRCAGCLLLYGRVMATMTNIVVSWNPLDYMTIE